VAGPTRHARLRLLEEIPMNVHALAARAACCLVASALLSAAALAAPFPKREEIVPPEPVLGNAGIYFAPYTQDDTIAEWVDVGIKAAAAGMVGQGVGQAVGSAAGQAAGGGVGELVGSVVGGEGGRNKARDAAIARAGGWDHIKATSDLSFHSLEELAAWLYALKSQREDYKQVMALVREIYPELKNEKYGDLIRAYHKRQRQRAGGR
jgi:hypothetical protein